MQLSLTYKRCSCGKCVSAKDCFIPNSKSINDKGKLYQQVGQPVRHRTFSRARQSRPRGRHLYSNQQHRLDHTYAAAEITSGPVEAPVLPTATMNNGHHKEQQQQQPQQQPLAERLLKINGNLALSATWSPKAVDLECQQRSWSKLVAYDDRRKENRAPLAEFNGRLKQYQKYPTVNNKIQGIIKSTAINSSRASKLLNEERRRWIAATALLELSKSI